MTQVKSPSAKLRTKHYYMLYVYIGMYIQENNLKS